MDQSLNNFIIISKNFPGKNYVFGANYRQNRDDVQLVHFHINKLNN